MDIRTDNTFSADKEFTMRNEVFFVSYHDVIKSPYPLILKRINESIPLQRALHDSIHVSAFQPYKSLESLETFCFQRRELSLFDYLKKVEFDTNQLETQMLFRYDDIYHSSSLYAIGNAVHIWMRESFVQHIYIHTDEYDPRIHADIQLTYKDFDRVTYVTGPILDAINALQHKPTAYFISNIDYIIDLASDKEKYLDYTHLFIADYRYNYIETDDGDFDYRFDLEPYLEDAICRQSLFKPIEFTPEHFVGFEHVLEVDDGISFKLAQEE